MCALAPPATPAPVVLRHSQLYEARSKTIIETRVPSTTTYIKLRGEVERLNLEILARRQEVDRAAADRDAALTAMADYNAQKEVGV